MKRYLALWLFLAVALVFAQPYTLDWGAVTNGGTEFPDGRLAPGYKLADNVGNGSSASDEILTDGVNYMLYPGYRYIDLDLRKPVSAIDPMDTITHSPSFLVSWTGVDTTAEDGEGWGIRYYDIQYAVEDPGLGWNTWFTGVTFTNAVFGPMSPIEVKAESTYYFRARAYDLATNEEDEHVTFDQKTQYQPIQVSFTVYNPTTLQPVWHADDTFDAGQTVTMEAGEVLYIENNFGGDSTILAVRAFPTALDSATHEPWWSLGDNPGRDIFAVRAHFDDNVTPPVLFGADDIVFENFTFVDDPPGGWYGGPTHGILSPNEGAHTPAEYTEHLWMQMQLPTSVTQHGDTIVYEFFIQVKGRNP